MLRKLVFIMAMIVFPLTLLGCMFYGLAQFAQWSGDGPRKPNRRERDLEVLNRETGRSITRIDPGPRRRNPDPGPLVTVLYPEPRTAEPEPETRPEPKPEVPEPRAEVDDVTVESLAEEMSQRMAGVLSDRLEDLTLRLEALERRQTVRAF